MAAAGRRQRRGGLPRGVRELARLLRVTTTQVRRLAGELMEALRVGGQRLYLLLGVWWFRRARAARRRASG